MNRKYLYLGLMLFILTIVLIEPTYCQRISHATIKAATKTFLETLNDWMPAIIAAGLTGSGICIFANKYSMGIAGLAGTGFLYAAKSFAVQGQAAVLSVADQILQIM
jgi:hypothetical protein